MPSANGDDSREFTVALNFDKFELGYRMTYHDTISNQLYLVSNNKPDAGAVHNEAVLSFGQIRDEQGYPFLRCNFSAHESIPDGTLEDIEFVAKRTDSLGIRNLGLTKNERLRLGYAVREDGTFEPDNPDEEFNQDLPEDQDELFAQLERHTTAAAMIHRKLVAIKEERDKRLRDATNGVTKAFSSITGSPAEVKREAPLLQKKKGFRKRASESLETPPPSQRGKNGYERTPQSVDEDIKNADTGKLPKRQNSGNLDDAPAGKLRRRRGI